MLFFLDESGTDHKEAPYEVLASVAIPNGSLWPLIRAVRGCEVDHFGATLSSLGIEFKGDRLLKRKVFRLATQSTAIPKADRTPLAGSFLLKGKLMQLGKDTEPFVRDEYTAYGQACLSFVDSLAEILRQHSCKVFAAIVSPDAPQPSTDYLRRDYAFLFERFYYSLEDLGATDTGLLVFDEYERSSCKRLIDRMARYFTETATGRLRSTIIVPEPFFVHSDLTTATRIADVAAYALNWGFRLPSMTKPVRQELVQRGKQFASIQYRGTRKDASGTDWNVYGIFYLDDLRPRVEREA